MRVLVTGGTGFIGSNLVDLLLEKGYEVSCLVRENSNLQWLKGKKIQLIISDFKNFDNLGDIIANQDYIYHLAGQITAKTENEYIEANVIVTQNFLNTIVKYNKKLKRFLFMGSQTAIGPSISINSPIDELSITNPITAYGRSKKLAEDIVMAMSTNLPVTIVRAPAVYGPRDNSTLPIFKLAYSGIGTLIGLNKKYISTIYAKDLAEGAVLAAEHDNSLNQTYFISSDEFSSWDEIIDAITMALNKESVFKIRIPDLIFRSFGGISEFFGKLFGYTPVFNYEKSLDMTQDFWTCSNQKAKNEIGFSCRYSLIEGMKETVLWYKKNNWL